MGGTLRIHFDLHLTHAEHISLLMSTCLNKLCQINTVENSFDRKTVALIKESLVIRKLLYCSIAWANTSSKNFKKLQTVQNLTCRIITNIKK